MKEYPDNIEDIYLIKNIKENFFIKYNVDSISKFDFIKENLILNYICNNLSVDEIQYIKLMEIFNKHPKILNSAELLKLNRSVSYMTFIIKEIYEYLTYKTQEGIPIYKIKQTTEKISNLEKLLSLMTSSLRD